MLKFHTRIVCLAAVLAAIGPASVADAKTRQYTSHIVSSPMTTADGYPGVGGTAYLAGSLETERFGSGALIDRVTITSQPFERNLFTFEGTEVAFFDRGAVRSVLDGYSIIEDDGSQKVVVDGRITGGTERFRGATGHYQFRGTIPPGSTELTGGSTGRIKF